VPARGWTRRAGLGYYPPMNRDWWRAFLDGLASLMDWAGALRRGTPYDGYATPAEADAAALAGDWQAVGDDLRAALRRGIPEDDPSPPGNRRASTPPVRPPRRARPRRSAHGRKACYTPPGGVGRGRRTTAV
jgi:hypothetical protein